MKFILWDFSYCKFVRRKINAKAKFIRSRHDNRVYIIIPAFANLIHGGDTKDTDKGYVFGKLPATSPKLENDIKKAGFVIVPQKGYHVCYGKPRSNRETITAQIKSKIMEIKSKYGSTNESLTLVVVGGDTDLVPTLDAVKSDFTVKVFMWKETYDMYSQYWSKLEDKITYMNANMDEITQTVIKHWREKLPPKEEGRSLSIRFEFGQKWQSWNKDWLKKFIVDKAEEIFKVPIFVDDQDWEYGLIHLVSADKNDTKIFQENITNEGKKYIIEICSKITETETLEKSDGVSIYTTDGRFITKRYTK